MAKTIIFEGWISILATLIAQSREIQAIYLQRDKYNSSFALLEQQAGIRNIPVLRVDEDVIATHANGHSHGGAIAIVGPRQYQSFEMLGQGAPTPFIVMLDGVEDPFNFGQAIRALYLAGAHGLVVRPRDWTVTAGIVARASAGTSELMPTAVAETILQAVEQFKRRGLAIACTSSRGQTIPIYQADLTRPLFVVIGGEKRGISRSLAAKADLMLQVPYERDFQQSLGATSAAAVLAFEVMRQRRYGKS
jgi:23S rRNA (guanosine2251-2'-O)-methyltransferase